MVGPQETAGESLVLTHSWARPSGVVAVRSGSGFSPAPGEARMCNGAGSSVGTSQPHVRFRVVGGPMPAEAGPVGQGCQAG